MFNTERVKMIKKCNFFLCHIHSYAQPLCITALCFVFMKCQLFERVVFVSKNVSIDELRFQVSLLITDIQNLELHKMYSYVMLCNIMKSIGYSGKLKKQKLKIHIYK